MIFKANPAAIAGINIENRNDTMVPLTNVGHPKSMDFDAKQKTIIFADSVANTINVVPINNITNVTTLLRNSNCVSLAFDWISRTVYYSSIEKNSINVFKLENSSMSRTLIQDRKMNPMYIAIEPLTGVMFWADWEAISVESGRIETAYMNGSNRKVFLNTNMQFPTDLTIDSVGKRMYWCDRQLHNLQSIDLNGMNRRIEIAQLRVPISLTLGPHNSIYFIESKGTLMKYTNGSVISPFYQGNNQLYAVKLYDPDRQKGSNHCLHDSCPELCLPTPNGAVCACSNGFEIKGNVCVRETNYTQPMSQCPPDMFKCHEKHHCIPNTYLCDGIDNCGDGSDESSEADGPCANVHCTETQLKCDKTTCIVSTWICDGEKDCLDGTDEDPAICNQTCSQTEFKCKVSGRCIPQGWRCDHFVDCGLEYNDSSDEADCSK